MLRKSTLFSVALLALCAGSARAIQFQTEINFAMPSSVDPDSLHITGVTIYSKDDNNHNLVGKSLLPTSVGDPHFFTGDGGLQIFGRIPDPNNPPLTKNIVEIEITTTFSGPIQFTTTGDSGHTPWKESEVTIGATHIFDLRQQSGSAILNLGAFTGFLSASSNDPTFVNSPFTVQGFPTFQAPIVPEFGSSIGLSLLLAGGGLLLRRAKRSK